jgi:CDP-glucose 4,6-dehydratase
VIRSDGTPERDYIYVEDAALAYLAVIDSLSDPTHVGRVWNAGSGEPRSVLEVVETLIAVSGQDVEPEVRGEGLSGELDRQFLDSSAIRGELGWRPRWDFERGLGAAYDWYKRILTA